MTGHTLPRFRLDRRQVWQTGTLATELIADEEPMAHYVADVDSGHGHQITTAPETSCGRVVPNSMLVETEYDDRRCVDCVAASPDAQPYPAPPVEVSFSCPICPDGGSVGCDGDGGVEGLQCTDCGTCWPDGEYAPGVRECPPAWSPSQDDGQTAMIPRSGVIADEPQGNTASPSTRDTVDGEAVLHPDAYLVQPGMRVRCSHNHPPAWSLVLKRSDVEVTYADGRDPESLARFVLACGDVVDFRRSEEIAVVVDAPLPVAASVGTDESGDA